MKIELKRENSFLLLYSAFIGTFYFLFATYIGIIHNQENLDLISLIALIVFALMGMGIAVRKYNFEIDTKIIISAERVIKESGSYVQIWDTKKYKVLRCGRLSSRAYWLYLSDGLNFGNLWIGFNFVDGNADLLNDL